MISLSSSAFSLFQHSNLSQLSCAEPVLVCISILCRKMGESCVRNAGGGLCEANAVGRHASNGGIRIWGSGDGMVVDDMIVVLIVVVPSYTLWEASFDLLGSSL